MEKVVFDNQTIVIKRDYQSLINALIEAYGGIARYTRKNTMLACKQEVYICKNGKYIILTHNADDTLCVSAIG